MELGLLKAVYKAVSSRLIEGGTKDMAMTGDALGGQTATLMPLINGFMASRVVHVAAELGVADLLAQGAKTSGTLARETGTDAPSIHRLLRALASLDVVDEVEPGRFALSALGAQLRTDVPDSVRNLALTHGSEWAWRSWGELRHTIRTGEPAMQHVFGMDAFDYLDAHSQEAAIFNEAMAEITRQVARAVVAAYDFARFRTIVDVGGGNGTLIGAIFWTPNRSCVASSSIRPAGVPKRHASLRLLASRIAVR